MKKLISAALLGLFCLFVAVTACKQKAEEPAAPPAEEAAPAMEQPAPPAEPEPMAAPEMPEAAPEGEEAMQ